MTASINNGFTDKQNSEAVRSARAAASNIPTTGTPASKTAYRLRRMAAAVRREPNGVGGIEHLVAACAVEFPGLAMTNIRRAWDATA